MSEPRPVPQVGYREAFLRHLKQVERRNWENKIFYLPSDIRIWMNTKSPDEMYTNVVRLVSTFYEGFPKISADQCAKYLLVLAALLHPDVNCGNLIHIFARCNLSDDYLSLADPKEFYNSIVEDLTEERQLLPSNYTPNDYRAVTDAFDKVRWAFCPATLHLHMDASFPSGPCILPFFHGEVINKKGGTANVRHHKIQEDLVESEELKKALAFSKHEDPTFGWCYEFAVKSYVPGWKDIYKFESEAFRGVRDHKGVVQYLGEYHFREEGDPSPNHNIILEYGQQDLDEYLADTYPPVLTTEIIAFWVDLFKVADTLKRLHQLKYQGEDGRILYFKGWHGDIKPDNILRVHGEFKLADFGFTKFEKDEIGRSSTFILGGTRTYGAPECDDQRLGTSTPHLQTIDTWSFGCVLSAVATWVILGSQAYDNYRQVRMLEIAKLRQRVKDGKGGSAPSGDDAFHDGTKVLPSVLHWHDFLRNSSRKADTISHRVLDLIEEKMLLENPSERLNFEQLCGKLEDILCLAWNDHQKLKERRDLRMIAPDTLEALLQLDKCAPATATPIVQVNTTQNAGRSSGSLLPNGRSQPRPESERVRKSERLDRIIIGKTANREEAIKTDLGLGIVNETQEICDSPQQDAANADEGIFEASSSEENGKHPPASSNKGKGINVPSIKHIHDSPVAAHIESFPTAFMGSRASSQNDIQQPPKSSEPQPPSNTTNTNAFFSPEGMQQSPSPVPKNTSEGKSKEIASQSGHFGQEEESSNINQGHNFRSLITPPRKVPGRQIPTGNPTRSAQGYDQLPDAAPSNTLPPTPKMSPETVSERDASKNPLVENRTSMPSLGSSAIFEEHTRLDMLWGDKKGTFASLLGKTPKDPWLKNFISNRDIVFVVDNAASMKQYWDIATEVLITLAMKIGPLDKDGLDLKYTIGHEHNLEDVKGWGIPKTFKSSMQYVGQEISWRHKTNMRETLGKIFDKYIDTSKKMTLIVLTDGLWEGCINHDDVEKLIVSFITKLKPGLEKWESRWFSIQFVSFGEDAHALQRLQKLDDNMPIEEDVIDTKPWWYHDVTKLILGSMTDGDDKDDPPSPSPIRPSSVLSRPATSTSFHTLPVPERRPSAMRDRISKIFK